MAYVGRGDEHRDACVFCDRLDGDDDVASLILLRLDHVFVIMNLYPYATGHLMIIPHHHGTAIEDAPPDALAAMASVLPMITRATRRALGCTGFNIGMNAGAVAGAGIADHLHLHVVPRWPGDANFMPVIGQVTVLPEALPATYAKLRLEIARESRPPAGAETSGAGPGANHPHGTGPTPRPGSDGPRHPTGDSEPTVAAERGGPGRPGEAIPLLVSPDGTHLWLDDAASPPHLPVAHAAPGEPIWRAAVRVASPVGRATVTGLAGPPATLARATPDAGPLSLALRLEHPPSDARGDRFVPLAEARSLVPAIEGWAGLGSDPGPTS